MTLSTLPWHSMAVSVQCCCSKPSAIAQRGVDDWWTTSCSLWSSANDLWVHAVCSDCSPRPRFELGLSSRVPQVSAKRARPSCPIRPRLLDRPSQSSQSWPVNTISIVTIWRITDHHASAVKASPGRSSRRMRGNVLETSIAKRIGVAAVSVDDHSLNSKTGFVLGQPRDFKCVLFHTLPHCAKPMILLARVVACVDDSRTPPHRSRTQLAIALVTQNPCKQIVKCGASVFPGHCRKAKFTSQSTSCRLHKNTILPALWAPMVE